MPFTRHLHFERRRQLHMPLKILHTPKPRIPSQTDTSLERTSLLLEDSSAWKPMDAAMLRLVTPLPMAYMRPSTLGNAPSVEQAEESRLRELIDGHRSRLGLGTAGVGWDDELSYLLSPALAAYENERLTSHPPYAAPCIL